MSMEVQTNLESVIEKLAEKIEESIIASRVTNALLLAQKLELDLREPLQAQKVLRGLKNVEVFVKSDGHE